MVVSSPTVQVGAVVYAFANVRVQLVSLPPVPTVMRPFTSVPATLGLLPQLAVMVGAVPLEIICPSVSTNMLTVDVPSVLGVAQYPVPSTADACHTSPETEATPLFRNLIVPCVAPEVPTRSEMPPLSFPDEFPVSMFIGALTKPDWLAVAIPSGLDEATDPAKWKEVVVPDGSVYELAPASPDCVVPEYHL